MRREMVVSHAGRRPGLEESMAPRKAQPAPATQKSAAQKSAAGESAAPATGRRAARQEAAPATGGSDSNRLLREAAWSRMFGRTDAKNPFAR
jgi:hypothetical protein